MISDIFFKDNGSLEEYAVADLLALLYKRKTTGMLRIELDQIIKVIYIKEGSISFASSNDTNDRLGEVLIRLNKITSAQLEDAMQRLKPNISLGKMLVQLGYLSGKDLLLGAQKQAETIITSVFGWTKGSFSFIEGPLPKQLVDLKLEMPKVIFQGIHAAATRDWVLKHISSMESIFKFNDNEKDFYLQLQLSEEINDIVQNFDGKRSLSEISATSKLDDFQICKIAAALKVLDVIAKVEKVAKDEKEEKFALNIEEIMPPAPAEPESTTVMPSLEMETTPTEPIQEAVTEPQPEEKEKIIAPPVIPQTPATPPIFLKEEKVYDAAPKAPFKHIIAASNHVSNHDLDYSQNGEEKKRNNAMRFGIAALIILIIAIIFALVYYTKFIRQRSEFPQLQATNQQNEPSQTPSNSGSNQSKPVTIISMPNPAQSKTSSTPENKNNITTISTQGTTTSSEPAKKPIETRKPEIENKKTVTETKPVKPEVQPQTKNPENPPETKTPEKTSPTDDLSTLWSSARSHFNDHEYASAAKSWKDYIKKSGMIFTIQVELACESTTIQEAFAQVPDKGLFYILPLNFKNKSCYIIAYGVFKNKAQAEESYKKLPAIFVKQPYPPKIVPAATLLK